VSISLNFLFYFLQSAFLPFTVNNTASVFVNYCDIVAIITDSVVGLPVLWNFCLKIAV